MSVYEASITNPKKQLEFYRDLSEQLQQENQRLKEQKERLKNCYSSMTIIGRQQGRAYEQAKNYIIACNLLGLKDIKITLIDSDDKKRIEKAIEFTTLRFNEDNHLSAGSIVRLLSILKGEDK